MYRFIILLHLISSFSLTRSLLVPHVYVSIESIDCILWSSDYRKSKVTYKKLIKTTKGSFLRKALGSKKSLRKSGMQWTVSLICQRTASNRIHVIWTITLHHLGQNFKRVRNTTAAKQGPQFQRISHQLYHLLWSPED